LPSALAGAGSQTIDGTLGSDASFGSDSGFAGGGPWRIDWSWQGGSTVTTDLDGNIISSQSTSSYTPPAGAIQLYWGGGSWGPSGGNQVAGPGAPSVSPNGVENGRYPGVPPNSKLYSTPDGTNFWAPATADYNKEYEAVESAPSVLNVSDYKNYVNANIGVGGIYDYQRSGGIFYPAYTDASNFGVGVFQAGAG
jgi:hypothetical protein